MNFEVLTADLLRPDAREARGSLRQIEKPAVIRITSSIEASPGRVFDAWLDPRIAGKWLFATASRPMTRVAIDARVRGRFRLVDSDDGTEHTGVYFEIDRPRRLVFSLSMGYDLPATRVTAEIAPRGLPKDADNHTRFRDNRLPSTDVTVVHASVPPRYAAHMEARWTGMLYGLGLMLSRK